MHLLRRLLPRPDLQTGRCLSPGLRGRRMRDLLLSQLCTPYLPLCGQSPVPRWSLPHRPYGQLWDLVEGYQGQSDRRRPLHPPLALSQRPTQDLCCFPHTIGLRRLRPLIRKHCCHIEQRHGIPLPIRSALMQRPRGYLERHPGLLSRLAIPWVGGSP